MNEVARRHIGKAQRCVGDVTGSDKLVSPRGSLTAQIYDDPSGTLSRGTPPREVGVSGTSTPGTRQAFYVGPFRGRASANDRGAERLGDLEVTLARRMLIDQRGTR
jgi:hypothetical protein